ncbi:MAG: SAM-dependent methyltransferase [Spirillospora sp.]
MPMFDGHAFYEDDTAASRTIFQTSWPAMWHVLSGGKDGQPGDRVFAGIVAQEHPEVEPIAALRLAARTRLVRYMVAAASIRQLIVVGCDLPLLDEVHQVADRVAPGVQVVYATGDRFVMIHARGQLGGANVHHVDAAATDPAAVLAGAASVLNLREPVGVLILNTLDAMDAGAARDLTRAFADAVAPRSHLAFTHLTTKTAPVANSEHPVEGELRELFRRWQIPPPVLRQPDEIGGLLDGWNLLEPGVTSVPQWRPESLLHQLGPDLPGRIRLVVATARKRAAPAFSMTPAHLRVPGEPDPSNPERTLCP